jgi:hypothetical protein
MFLASYHSRAGPVTNLGCAINLNRHDKTLSTREYVAKGNKTLGKQGGNN